MVKADDLIIPVYLNQRIVFDLVAMLQGGIAGVTQVSQTQKDSGTASAGVGAAFGLSKALTSLLRIDFSGKAAGTLHGESNEVRTEERIHTPASLFIVLRSLLHAKTYITSESKDMKLSSGRIVEFSAILRRNPLLETIVSFVEMIDMAQVFEEKPNKNKGNQGSELQKIKKQMELFVSALNSGEMLDLTTTALESSHRCVISLEKQYLNDPSMSDLVDGTFRVVGKVTRVIEKDQGAISLNRKSALGKLPNSILGQLADAFKQMDGFTLPELEWEIPGPVIQVLPIAIFA